MHKIEMKQLNGVGSVSMDLTPDQRAYVFIGENGSGKTKILEAVFQCLFLRSSITQRFQKELNLQKEAVICAAVSVGDLDVAFNLAKRAAISLSQLFKAHQAMHDKPVVFIGSQLRGHIGVTNQNQSVPLLGGFDKRREEFLRTTLRGMAGQFNSLGMKTDLEQWFLQRAAAANRYQNSKDERSVEIDTVLKLLNKVTSSVDADFLEVTGAGRVLLKINGNKVQLDHLSSGYSSVLKIFQCIVAGYGALTNQSDLETTPGIVVLDEVESHLHVSWQAKIVPLLKSLFPNTQFYISTHSPLVLAQLADGEAYSLHRKGNGVVSAKQVKSPNRAALVDILKQAFGIDMNELKRESMSPADQKQAKQALLKLLDSE